MACGKLGRLHSTRSARHWNCSVLELLGIGNEQHWQRAIGCSINVVRFDEGKTMAKSGIHPKWYPDAKVYCNGELVMTVGSTQPEIHVDVWSGNHPFFTGTQKLMDTEGRVERFLRKYGMLDSQAKQ